MTTSAQKLVAALTRDTRTERSEDAFAVYDDAPGERGHAERRVSVRFSTVKEARHWARAHVEHENNRRGAEPPLVHVFHSLWQTADGGRVVSVQKIPRK